MNVETAGRRTTMTAPFALSSSVETTMYPDPDAGALVASVQVSAITEVLSESFGGRSTFSLDLAQARPIPRSRRNFRFRPGVCDACACVARAKAPEPAA